MPLGVMTQGVSRKSLMVWDPTVYSLALGHITIFFTCSYLLSGPFGQLGQFLHQLQGLLCVLHMALFFIFTIYHGHLRCTEGAGCWGLL